MCMEVWWQRQCACTGKWVRAFAIHVSECMCVHVCVCVCMCDTYTHAHTCTHTHAHTCTHTCTRLHVEYVNTGVHV